VKLGKRELATGHFCFHPKNKNEARRIQEILLDMGFCWGHSGRAVVAHLSVLETGTLLLKNGCMSCSGARVVSGRLLEASALEEGAAASKASSQDVYLAEMFNKLFDRMEALEARIAQIETRLPADDPSVGELKKASLALRRLR
jgi:hypothetical protein